MTDENIKEIASKADQLIEIIQNIKDRVGGATLVSKQDLSLPVSGKTEEKDGTGWWS